MREKITVVGLCVCVLLGKISFYCLLVPDSYSAYQTKTQFRMWISLKAYRSKVIMRSTFHGDPRPSL